ncbi:MAG: hypothetical protein K6C08_03335 [Oscillospiraceae bacterium]|nr:hypothetical protein [Oscillospiraceae bacterium]
MNKDFAKSAYRYFAFWGVLTSLALTVCTTVDALLIGNLVGNDGLAATNLSTPVFLCYALLGIMLGVGANVRIGRALGASDIGEANRVFRKLLGLGVFISLLCWCPLLFRHRFFRFLGATGGLMPLVSRYLIVVLCSAPLFVFYHVLSVSVRTDSDPKLAAAASAIVISVNVLLDLLFMLVFKWGILGASASLCIAEGMGVLTLLTHFAKKNALLRLRLALPKWSDLREFSANGFGMGSAYVFQALVMLAFNKLLLRYSGEDAAVNIAIYGVLYTMSTIPVAVCDGAANALSTITAFFLGEADIDGVFGNMKQAIRLALSFSVAIALVCAVFAGGIAGIFGLPPEIANGTAATAIRIFSVSMLFSGVNTVMTAFWQSIGRPALAGGMSLLRNCVLLLLFGIGLISRQNIFGVSMAFICAEAFCCLLLLPVRKLLDSRRYLRQTCKVPDRVFENLYVIHTDSMAQISGDLERISEEWEIPMKKSLTINFICEELLLNIIKFGLEDAQKEHYIAIRLMEQEGEYALRIRDNVHSYNPFETQGDAIDNGVMKLIRKKSKSYTYQRKMIFNYLYMVI